MKKNLLFTLLILLAVSCGEKESSVEDIIERGDLSEIRAKKSELNTEQNELNDKIARLNEEIEKLDKNESRSLVTTQTLKNETFKHYVEVQGDVETDQNIIIYPEYTGILSSIRVEEGQQVTKGQVLAKIEDGGLSSQLAELESQLTLAKTSFERQERLWDKKIGSEIQFLEARTNYEALQNSTQQLRTQLSKTTVRAPFTGIIDDIIADPGQVVSSGQNELFRLVNLSEMYVTAEVPENYMGKIDEGTQVMVEIGSIGKEFEGKVERVSNNINPNNRSFKVRVAIPNSDGKVKPNLIATLKINDYTSENTKVIPLNILQENAKGESIAYVVEKANDSTGVAKKAIVKTGLNYDNKIEVLEGLEEGDLIIVEGARTIREGQEIKFNN